MSIKRPFALAAILLAAFSGGHVGAASAAAPPPTAFKMLNEFSIAANPNGVWSYLADGKNLKVSQKACFNGAVSGFNCWWSSQPVPNSIYVGRNVTKQALIVETIVDPPTYLWLDPEGGSITVRFTAPTAATYAVIGDFLGIDTNEQSHPAQVLHGKKVLFSTTVATYTQKIPFKVSVTLAAGEHVDFTTSVGGTYNNLSTGLRATIQQQ